MLIPSSSDTRFSIVQGCLLLLTIIAVGTVLRLMGSVFIPLTVALLLSFLTLPLVLFLHKKAKFPQTLASFVVVLVLGCFFYYLLQFVILCARLLAGNFEIYQNQLIAIFQDITTRYNLPDNWIRDLNLPIGENLFSTISSLSVSILSQTASIVNQLILVILFVGFILLDDPLNFLKLKKSLSPRSVIQILRTSKNISKQINRYLLTKVSVSLLTGALFYLVLLVAKMDLAYVWGGLAVILNFIPTFGSIIITIGITIVALVQFYPDFTAITIIFISMLLIQVVIGNIVEPILQGARLKLSPVIILISLVIWGWLWGPIGMILSVPLTETIKIVCRNIPALNPVSTLISQVNPSPFRFVLKYIKK